MSTRWVHTWKVAEDTRETKAKARLVVKGFTDPDLTEIRSESPTLSRLSRQLVPQMSSSRGFRWRMGAVKTALLSGDREEARRDVYAEPPQDLREKLQVTLSMTSWINRSDEALMDMRKKIGVSTWRKFYRWVNNDPSTDSRMATSSLGAITRSGHRRCHDHGSRQSEC